MKNIRPELIWFSIVLSIILVVCRVAYSQQLYALFLIWNLFLAWIPYQLSKIAVTLKREQGWYPWLLCLGWLLFFPNAPYIITDLFHLRHRPPVPLWFDTAMYFSAAWSGLLLGVMSMMNIERFLEARWKPVQLRLVVPVIFVLCAFGIYAGRYLRWNSWHVLTQPGEMVYDMVYILGHPAALANMLGVTIIFALLLLCCYYSIKSLSAHRTNTPEQQERVR